MMKEYTFSLDQYLLSTLSPPIRKKVDVIALLMHAIKIMLINQNIKEEQTVGQLTLIVNKMSRIFISVPDKVSSIHFPFHVTENESGIAFHNHHIDDIDSRITSDVIRLTKSNDTFNGQCLYKFFDSIDEIQHHGPTFWGFIKELFMFEPGYIRYDYDEIHQNGNLHPLSHYDVFFSSNATFKIGLNERADKSSIVDLLDTDSTCHFISLPSD